jgi:hypothetical protein
MHTPCTCTVCLLLGVECAQVLVHKAEVLLAVLCVADVLVQLQRLRTCGRDEGQVVSTENGGRGVEHATYPEAE